MFDDGIVPGVDPAHVDGAVGAGLLRAQSEGVTQTKFLWDGEGSDVAKAGVAVHRGAGTGQHTGQVLHVFHSAHEVAKVFAIGHETADVDDVYIGEFVSHCGGRVHVAKRGGEDDVEAFAGQGADDLFGVSALSHNFYVGGVSVFHVFLNVHAANVVGLGPTAVIVGANVNKRNVVTTFDGCGDLVAAFLFRVTGAATAVYGRFFCHIFRRIGGIAAVACGVTGVFGFGFITATTAGRQGHGQS